MKFDRKFVNFNLYFIYIKLGVFQKTKLKRNVLRWIRGTLKAQLIGILWWYLKFCVLFFKIKKKKLFFYLPNLSSWAYWAEKDREDRFIFGDQGSVTISWRGSNSEPDTFLGFPGGSIQLLNTFARQKAGKRCVVSRQRQLESHLPVSSLHFEANLTSLCITNMNKRSLAVLLRARMRPNNSAKLAFSPLPVTAFTPNFSFFLLIFKLIIVYFN